ncbi:MAG: cellulose synthase/poly-beta-1,6-N-acetylglucosamine synthase-like glycosyltransferase, partial [Bacteroidia bacterium]
MWVVVILSVAVIAIFFSIQLLCLVTIFKSKRPILENDGDLPNVSILLAARNEEALLHRCLTAIDALDYPRNKLQVLIGNDDSTDATESIAKEFISNKVNFTLINIDKLHGKAKGKANVLARLAHEASGEFFFITDVDVKLPKNWIHALLHQFTEEVGIVSGTSTCAPTNSNFSILQSIDWLHFMGYIQSFANIGVACTSVGNNMAVRAKAYWDTGGYEHIDFSITEDYKLFKEVTDRGWQWRTILDPDSLGLAWYIPSIKEMWHQRKRWLIGSKELPILWKSLIIIYGLFVPALIVLAIFAPINALIIWLFKLIVQTIYIKALQQKVGLKSYSILSLIGYEFYVLINTVCTAVFYFAPIPSVW